MVYHCQPSSKGKSIEKRAIFFFFLIHLKWGMCVGKSGKRDYLLPTIIISHSNRWQITK